LDFAAEHLVASGDHLVEQQDVRVHGGGDGEAQPRAHAHRVLLQRLVDVQPDVREVDDRLLTLDHRAVVDAHERTREHDVVPAAEVLVETRLEMQHRRDVTDHVDHAFGRLDDPGDRLEQRALARAVRPDDAQRLAMTHLERDVAERPELALCRWPHELRERRPERRLARESEAVLDAQIPNVDGVERAGESRGVRLGDRRHPRGPSRTRARAA
jgi:hypothetical protein